jgi:hypothetical protein
MIAQKSFSLASRPMDSQHAPPLAVKLSHMWLYKVCNIGFIHIRTKQLAITYFPLIEYIHVELVSVALFGNELVFLISRCIECNTIQFCI